MAVHVRAHEVMGSRLRGEAWESTGIGDCLQAALLVGGDPGRQLLSQLAFTEVRPRLRPLEQRLVYDGMPTLIKLDALPGRLLHGHIQRVANMAVQESHWVDFRVYHTWIAIDETMEGLRPDMSAEVTVVDGSDMDPVVTVPVQAILHSAGDGNHGTCFVMTDNGPRPRDVVVGMQDGQRAEIQSGLDEGEEVILDPRCIP
jgi:multidrug efflux pump subunit AcrA (membrane-fusion protein)